LEAGQKKFGIDLPPMSDADLLYEIGRVLQSVQSAKIEIAA